MFLLENRVQPVQIKFYVASEFFLKTALNIYLNPFVEELHSLSEILDVRCKGAITGVTLPRKKLQNMNSFLRLT